MMDVILFGCEGCCGRDECEEVVEDKEVGQSSRECCSSDPNCQCDNCRDDEVE